MIVEKSAIVGNVRINYAETSSIGPTIILLHGIPGRWQEYLSIMPDLGSRYHLIALDFRGHGKSGRTPGEYHSSYYGKDVLGFLRKELEEPVVIFGMSAGGLVALDVAVQAPERINALIVGDAPIDIAGLKIWMKSEAFTSLFSDLRTLAGMEEPLEVIFNNLADLPVEIPGEQAPIRYADQPGMDVLEVKEFAKTLTMLDPGVLEYHAEGRADEYLVGLDLNKMLPGISCPVLLIQADPKLGAMMTDDAINSALDKLPNAISVRIEDSGHDLLKDAWKDKSIVRAIFSFLDTLK
jgi:pimeloyl-ACP methyl ester carboxylesterase